jgi:hypothetical protein
MEKLRAPHGPPDLLRDYIHSISEQQMPPDFYSVDNLANEFERSMVVRNGPPSFDQMENFYREAQQHRFGPPQFADPFHAHQHEFERFYEEGDKEYISIVNQFSKPCKSVGSRI